MNVKAKCKQPFTFLSVLHNLKACISYFCENNIKKKFLTHPRHWPSQILKSQVRKNTIVFLFLFGCINIRLTIVFWWYLHNCRYVIRNLILFFWDNRDTIGIQSGYSIIIDRQYTIGILSRIPKIFFQF